MKKGISRLVAGGTAALILPLAVMAATTSTAHAAANSGPSCDYTVNANNINIRTSPDGSASGYKLENGYYWLSDPLKYSSVQGGQRWIYGENTGIHGWVGARYLDYNGTNSACKAPL